ncbi:hypothetical protein M0805_002699 [Coniferiporia weirii]|nr:hypothetical protein M0805_002699 [Coniferiporia weirii]
MASSATCTTCCSNCSTQRPEARPGTSEGPADAISFEHLLSAGSITLSLLLPGVFCDHRHAEDGWHTLRDVRFLSARTSAQDAELLAALSFLLSHNFIMATYREICTAKAISLRIYLIPHDCPGKVRSLRKRDESKVLKPARKYLRLLLARVSKSLPAWHGKTVAHSSGLAGECFLPPNDDQRSLAQIFSELATTKVDVCLPDIPRLRTLLYDYQRESVATMLEREAPGKDIDDPLYIPVKGMRGERFYFQPASMELLLARPRLSQSRGGFLCEELGTGKTVMTLALILATLDTLPRPPEHCSDRIITPLARRIASHLSSGSSRKSAVHSGRTTEGSCKLPTLVEHLCHYIRANPDNIDVRSYEDELEDRQLWKPLMKNTPYYLHDDSVLVRDIGRPQRRHKTESSRLIYLSAATLIVVPKTLQAQWSSEILKHCSSSIRTLVIKQKGDIPPAHELASNYDIVLIKDTRISLIEAPMSDMSALNDSHNCHCLSFPHVRVPDCTCRTPRNISPLLQIRWKRLVRDEGHNAATQSTTLNNFLSLISSERKWIVTGTPTTGLLGLSFGSTLEDDAEVREMPSQGMPDALPLVYRICDETSGSESREDEFIAEGDAREMGPYAHVWSSADRTDLRKLGDMMSSFLGVLPFATNARAFELVVEPLFGKDGPLPNAPRVLEQVMSAYMVRHRITDIERCVRLPPIREETVLLDLDEFGQMTYNVMLSFVAVNAVDSERKDQDYLFHPSKTALLTVTIENLSNSLFWRVDEDALDYELAENLHRAENALAHAMERNQPIEDIRLVERAIVHIRKALNDQQFRDMQHGLELPYRVYNVPPRTMQAWGIVHDTVYSKPGAPDERSFFMFPSYVLELRNALARQPLVREERLAERAMLVREKDYALAAFVDARKRERRRDTSEKSRLRDEAETGRLKLSQARRAVDSKEKLQEKHDEFRKAQERLMALAEADEQGISEPIHAPSLPSVAQQTPSSTAPLSELLRNSPFAKTRIGNSTSSKLNYILNEVRQYSTTEKILIFSNQPFNLMHLTESLDLLGVKYLHFMSETGGDHQRDQWLTTFETSETYRVFLMELKYGARGLNIVSASRVIFCEPVWHADVESQAVKRVHRIGQTRPVTVKTLAIRSTFEEYMIQRRRDFKKTGSKLPGLAEEMGVRQYLQNPVFLEAQPQSAVELDIPLLCIPELASTKNQGLGAEGIVDLSVDESSALMENAAIGVLAHGEGAEGHMMNSADIRPHAPDSEGESVLTMPPQKRRKVRFG